MKLIRVKKISTLLVVFLLLGVFIPGCQKNEAKFWSPGNPLDKHAIKIVIIHVDNAESGYSYTHDAGMEEARRIIGLNDGQIRRKLNVNDSDVFMIEHVMRESIAEGANIIIATSMAHTDICEKLAVKYPNIIFVNAFGCKKNDTNFTNYCGRVYQVRYLSGIAAGLKTKTNKIGFVAAMDKSNSEVTSSLNAFAMGVESVNPDAKVYVIVTHNWFDPAGERQASQKLIAEGCDVIAQYCNTATPQIEAEKAGVWGIGYNSDMSKEAPDAVLTSVIWNWDVYYTWLINSVIDGNFSTEPYYGGLADGIVDIMPLNDRLVLPDIEEAIAAAKDRILNDGFNVFDDVMETNDGRKIGVAGGTLSDSEIIGGINWYYRNIVELK